MCNMNEEIDIIELLKRVKEGKAPKKIEINGNIYNYKGFINIQYMYEGNEYNMFSEGLNFDTKIKILDKPIIEELKPVKYGNVVTIPDRDILMNKINEIIEVLNGRNL